MKNNKSVLVWWLIGLLMLAILSPNVIFLLPQPPQNPLYVSQSLFEKVSENLSMSLPFCQAVLLELGVLALVGRPWVWFLINFLFFLWLPFELIYIQRYATVSSAHVFSILAETNSDEIAGYGGRQLWFLIGGYSIWVTVLISMFFIFLRKPRLLWKHRARWWWLAATLLIVPAVLLTRTDWTLEESEAASVGSEICTANQGCSFPSLVEDMQDSYPFGVPLRLFSYFQQNTLLRRHGKQLKDVRLGMARDSSLADINETWVVVIGESSRAANWSLGGYERDTNPLLSRRDRLIWFNDAASMAANTRVAVPLMLSHASIDELAADKFKPSWIGAFKEAGFFTYWFSVQIPVGNHDTSIGIYANLADEIKFLNMGTYRSFGAYDNVLLDALHKAVSENHKKKLIVLHTLGSHAPYQRRYPAEFDYFKPSLSHDSGVGVFDIEHKEEVRNTYDNSIRFTDYFLDRVITDLSQQQGVAAMWYASDHGQTLVDDGCKNVGHGFRSRNNFHIPLIFWYSEQYAQYFPENIKHDKKIRTRAYMQDFYGSLLGSAGFHLPDDLVGRQMLRADYNSGIRFVTVDGVTRTDFDKEFPVGQFCPRSH